MYYKIRKNRRKELQEGRTIVYLAEICGYTRQYLTYIFNGKLLVTYDCAEKILKNISEISIPLQIRIDQKGIIETINYFFKKDE